MVGYGRHAWSFISLVVSDRTPRYPDKDDEAVRLETVQNQDHCVAA
jgi:hypothetical protein